MIPHSFTASSSYALIVLKKLPLATKLAYCAFKGLCSNVKIETERYLNSKHMMSLFNQNVDILKDPETVRQLGSILKTNVRACKAVGHPFVLQLGRIYLDMLNVYKCLSENISSAIQSNGEPSTPGMEHMTHVIVT